MGDHLDERLKGFDKNSLEHLFSVKQPSGD
jgi:hypothetical protein